VPAHHLFNGSIVLRPSDDRWQVSIWGKNLAGARYFTDARRDVLFHADTIIYGAPRTVGATLAIRYR
jgi:hypothetical protein